LFIDGAGVPYFEVVSDTAVKSAAASQPLAPGWTHLAGTFDALNTNIILWVNGEEIASATSQAPQTLPSAGLALGNGFDGYLDELRISDGVVYNAPFVPERYVTNFPTDIAHFHFDEAEGAYAVDYSSLANDLTLSSNSSFSTVCQYYRCGMVVTLGGYVQAPAIT